MALELSHRRYGAGPPVVILHGLFGSAHNWQTIARGLAATHCVYTLDLRNHGDSPWKAAMSYPEMAADVRHTLSRLGLRAPALVGHSMGGKVAMRLALEQPEHVAALVVVDIAPVAYPQ
nr:alpha/beta fold hydrolase [Gammaproteobacteria bacterium]NIR82560.1 alpha/beta fold hydrolase [Gammaproteobacteria bacterium]NIR88607.1 alpha/beta fold hydrolase [Gammaproteobacteria bacterium]NIU03701.1 alpha/beta fold hydrolase [Gammaproteobacteria bacterium]NIV51036.1 alpha/beta fold hydrolase [Gammaproteobacteria bacterium]